MDKKESDDYEFEFQKLVEQRKTEIYASGMSRDELIDLIARNLVSYDSLCRSYEERGHGFVESSKIQAQVIDLLEKQNAELEKQNAETERKFLAAVNALPKAIQAGMKAGATVLASNAGKKGAINKNAPIRELKEWARQQASTMRGADTEIARTLAHRVPKHLKEASKNTERLIYDDLREQSKQGKPKQARGFTPSRLAASRNG